MLYHPHLGCNSDVAVEGAFSHWYGSYGSQIAAVVSDEQWLPVYEVLHLLFLLTDKTVDQTGHEGFPGEYQSGLKGDLKFLKDNDQPEPEYSCRRDGCPRDDHMGMDLVQQSIKRGKGIACWKEIEKW